MQGDLRVQAFDGGFAPFDTSISTRWTVVRPLCGRERSGPVSVCSVCFVLSVSHRPHTLFDRQGTRLLLFPTGFEIESMSKKECEKD